jgi:hypothetical protein
VTKQAFFIEYKDQAFRQRKGQEVEKVSVEENTE